MLSEKLEELGVVRLHNDVHLNPLESSTNGPKLSGLYPGSTLYNGTPFRLAAGELQSCRKIN